MPTASGNCRSLNEFLEAMITLATTNGWALLRGAAALGDSGEFPITTRYLRITFSSPQTVGNIRVSGLGLRETAGGANLTLDPAQLSSSGFVAGSPPENVLDGLSTTWWDGEPDTSCSLIYDFITPQAIRQVSLRAPSPSAVSMPRNIAFARSDDLINWDTFYVAPTVSLWTAGETKLFTFPLDGTNTLTSTVSGGVRRPVEYWLQGPGYDAARRVILGFRTDYDLAAGRGRILLNAATTYDSTKAWADMERSLTDYPRVATDASGEDIDYWIYVNSTRIIGVIKAGPLDYATFYSGFLAAFGDPDQYPFPLYVAGTTTEALALSFDENNVSNACFWDPGATGGRVMDQLGVWQQVGNQQSSTQAIRPLTSAPYHVYPWHHGVASTSGMFGSLSGDSDGGTNHLLNSIQATDQDDLPTLDAIVMGPSYGALGALQGVVAIPGAGLLVAETVAVIGGSNHRLFPNRTRRLGNSWVGIQE